MDRLCNILHPQPRQPPHGNYVILVICICNFVICIDTDCSHVSQAVKWLAQPRACKWLQYAKSYLEGRDWQRILWIKWDWVESGQKTLEGTNLPRYLEHTTAACMYVYFVSSSVVTKVLFYSTDNSLIDGKYEDIRHRY